MMVLSGFGVLCRAVSVVFAHQQIITFVTQRLRARDRGALSAVPSHRRMIHVRWLDHPFVAALPPNLLASIRSSSDFTKLCDIPVTPNRS